MPLLTRLKNKTIKICTMSNITIPESQRAVVFQGGGSLGAYEAGVFHVLYHWIKKDIHKDDENIFDIIAGTSIGAINSSIILSHILERKEEEELKDKGKEKRILKVRMIYYFIRNIHNSSTSIVSNF